jgi:hypothetical protein
MIKENIERIVLFQNEHHGRINDHDTPKIVEQLFLEEYKELLEAIELCKLGAPPLLVMNEIGDVGYLYIKVCSFGENIMIEGIMAMVFEFCKKFEIDINACIRMKVLRNDVKYPLTLTNEAKNYDACIKKSKEQYELLGGDRLFYFMFMMIEEE